MGSVTIASPFEVWCRGMESVLRDHGVQAIRRVGDSAWSCEGLPPADLLILAWRFVSRLLGAGSSRQFDKPDRRRVILVLEPDDQFTAKDFVSFDVDGLILSSASAQDFSHCISSVREGSRWVDPGVRLLLGRSQQLTPHWEELSSRELEVAQLAAAGLSNKQIAREIDLSPGTVKMHMHHILAKLRLTSRIALTQSPAQPRHVSQANDPAVLEPLERESGIVRLIRKTSVALPVGYISAITIADQLASLLRIYPG